MAESSPPGWGDLMGLLGGANPLSAIGKTVEQFRRGVNDLLGAVENFNTTMSSLNDVAVRATRLLDEIEEPLRALVPQVTRSIRAADAMVSQLSGPIDKVAPGISTLAETLASPVFTSLPAEIGSLLDTMGDVARRLQPLATMAENAGGMFGLRSLTSLLGGGTGGSGGSAEPPPPQHPAAPAASPPPTATTRAAAAAKSTTAKKATPVARTGAAGGR